MRKVKIITDTTSDLDPILMEQYGIDYVKMCIVEDGVESPARLDWTAEDYHEFYEKMRNGKRITTSQVPTTEFESVFGKYLDEGFDIVYVACSTKQSSSVSTGAAVAKRMLANYPDAKVICVDSLNSCIGQGMISIKASQFALQDKSADEVAEYVESIKKTVHEFATVHTLDYLKRAGRVSGSSAFFGNLMGIKPVLVSDANGAQAAYKKVKGRANSLKEIVSLLKENILDPEDQTIYLAHADCNEDDINTVIEILRSEINFKDIHIGYIGPIVGASVGPDCIGVWGWGKPVTFAAE